LLCDAAQTLGYLPIDVGKLGVDLLAAPGHKGAGGPLGTGMLYASPEIQDQMEPLMQGGTGSQSESMEMPGGFPEKVEPGNLNVSAIAGWSAGLESMNESPSTSLGQLADKLYRELSAICGLKVFGSPGPLPIASIQVEGMSPSDVAAILNAEFNIETRAGLHCAALVHNYLNSGDEGTLRISGGHQTTENEIEAACDALRAIVAELH
jgi:selenocysteine lyase/cysteine desulfurase